MVLAETKKQENIAEYIVHMYQTEELIRSYEFDLNRINNYVISRIPVSIDEKKELLLWYAAIIESMQNEGIETKGHLSETIALVDQLNQLHVDLLNEDNSYQKVFESASPFIDSQINEANHTITDPIQICLNAIYGFLLLKLDGKKVTDNQQNMLDSFGDMLSYLSYKFKQNNYLSSN